MRPGRMRNGFCWSAARLGAWTVVGCAGGQSPGALGASGGRRRHGRYSCFKTGRMGSPQAVAAQRPEGRALRRAETGRADDGYRRHLRPPGLGRRRGRQQSTPRADRRTSRSRSAYDRGASPAPIRFPPGNFKHSLTLFSKSFSSFPRGTCSLSVSRLYLALDGVYRPIWAAFPNNPTR